MKIPTQICIDLVAYYEGGIEPGGFLLAVLENDLISAVNHADNCNKQILSDIVLWAYYHLPMTCWGSKAIVAEWMRRKMLEAARESLQITGKF